MGVVEGMARMGIVAAKSSRGPTIAALRALGAGGWSGGTRIGSKKTRLEKKFEIKTIKLNKNIYYHV